MNSKHYLAIVFAICLLSAQAQIVQTRDLTFNNVGFRFNTDGSLFENAPERVASYHVPANGTVSSIYASNWWFGATVPNGDTATLVGTFLLSGLETSSGPMSNSYDAIYSNRYYKTWVMTIDKINYHRQHFFDQGYVPDSAIVDWPAQGREGIEIGPFAPYADVDGNGKYEPQFGDYPHIPGDMAVFFLRNSVNPQGANTTGGLKLKLAFGGFLYAFKTSAEPLANTVFIRTTIVNGDTLAISNFYHGMWIDGDIGSSTDDFGGTLPAKNAVYIYNSDNDDSGNPTLAYGMNPPVQSFCWLNTPLSCSKIYSTLEATEPFNGYARYYNYLSGKDGDGGLKLGGLFDFPENPSSAGSNSEVGQGNASGDRRMVASTLIGDLAPGESVCLDGAYVWVRTGGSNLDNVNALDTQLNSVQQFYNDFFSAGCAYYATSVPEQFAVNNWEIYPNPTSDKVFIDFPNQQATQIIVRDLLGREMLRLPFAVELSLQSLPAGTYSISIQLKDGSLSRHKLLVKE